jgi:tRNA dimethylallyltransferase
MIDEIKNLLNKGISHERLHTLGLEYRYISAYLSKKIDYQTMQSKLNIAINQFSKRQMTFFRRMEKREININWISINDSKNIYKIVDQYLK